MKVALLTVVSFLTIILVLNTGYYRTWLLEKPVQYWADFQKQRDDTSTIEGIRAGRYGLSYTISMRVKEVLLQKKVKYAVILFEPNNYYRDSLHMDLRVPEPAVFYYYTGLQGVWTNSAEVNKANYLLRVSKKGANLDEIKSPAQLQQILRNYRKFTPTL